MVIRRKIPAPSEISLWIVEMATLSGLPLLLNQIPERKIKRKKTPAAMALMGVFILTPLTS
jgi:hypothetical protein